MNHTVSRLGNSFEKGGESGIVNRVTFHVQGFISALRSKSCQTWGSLSFRSLCFLIASKGLTRALGWIKQRGLIPA